MYTFVLFTHVIFAMVFFGLPFTFGRWYRLCSDHDAILRETLRTLRLFVFVHLNFCGLMVMATGLWMSFRGHHWGAGIWLKGALLLVVLSLLNLNLYLGPALNAQWRSLRRGDMDNPRERRRSNAGMRRRIAVFSAAHHSLITLAVLLMILKI